MSVIRNNIYAATSIPVASSLFTRTMTYTERRMHVHRTTHVRTPNDVRMHTERCTPPFLPDGRAEAMNRERRQDGFPDF